MLHTTTFVGLDVHARKIAAVALDVMTGEVRSATFGYDHVAVADWVKSVDPKAPASTCRRSSRPSASTASSAPSPR